MIVIKVCEISQLVCSWNSCTKDTRRLVEVLAQCAFSSYPGKLIKLLNILHRYLNHRDCHSSLFWAISRRLWENHKLYQTPAKKQLSETLLSATGAGVLFRPEILAMKHFPAPRQTLLTPSYSDAGTISRQAWVWLPACSQQSMCSASWPQDDKPGETGWTGHCCLLHNLCQVTNKPPISQVTNKPMLAVFFFPISPHIPFTGNVPLQHHCQSHKMYRGFISLLFQPRGASVPLQIKDVSPGLPRIFTCPQIFKSTP